MCLKEKAAGQGVACLESQSLGGEGKMIGFEAHLSYVESLRPTWSTKKKISKGEKPCVQFPILLTGVSTNY